MDSLIAEYGPEGTKIGKGSGQRENPVFFIFMTGHANANANTGALNPKEQAALINNYCTANGQYCIDYYSIDTHDMDGNYWEDAGDNGNSDATNKAVLWSVENGTGLATITNNGMLTAITSGSVTVEASAMDGSGVSCTCPVTIKENSTGMKKENFERLSVYPNPGLVINEIDLSEEPAGLYLIRAWAEGSCALKQMIIQK